MPTVPYISNQPPEPEPYVPQWIYVTKRFDTFLNALNFTAAQETSYNTSLRGLLDCLDANYWPTLPQGVQSHIVTGSWAKKTQVRSISDVDLVYLLPPEVKARFDARTGNIQSAILQEVRNVLLPTYSTSTIKGDGPTVVVDLATVKFEIAPVFLVQNGVTQITDTNLCVEVCHTRDGGFYSITAPVAEVAQIKSFDSTKKATLLALVRMLKVWKKHCSVPIKSVGLEALAYHFQLQYEFAHHDAFWRDWLIRDFFEYMVKQAGNYFLLAGTGERIELGSDWQSKAVSAHANAMSACIYESANMNLLAGDEWQKIFGNFILKDAS